MQEVVIKKGYFMLRKDKRVTLEISALVLAVIISATLVTNQLIYRGVIKQCGERGLSIVRAMSELIDVALLLDIVEKQDKNNPDYLRMVELFTKVCHDNDVLYLYTLHYDKEGVVRYGVVADGLDDTLGLEVIGDDLTPELLLSLDEGAQIYEKPYMSEQWGILMTSSTPIRDNEGNIVGAIGVDFSQEDIVNRTLKLIKKTTIMISIFGIFISALTWRLLNKVLKKSVGDIEALEY